MVKYTIDTPLGAAGAKAAVAPKLLTGVLQKKLLQKKRAGQESAYDQVNAVLLPIIPDDKLPFH